MPSLDWPGVERRALVGDLRRVAGDGVRPVPRGLDPTVREGHHVLSSHQALLKTSVDDVNLSVSSHLAVLTLHRFEVCLSFLVSNSVLIREGRKTLQSRS